MTETLEHSIVGTESGLDDQPKKMTPRRGFEIFQGLFIHYWVAGLLGHYLEVIWSALHTLVFGVPFWTPRNVSIVPIATPYGLGALAVAIFTYPLIKKRKIHPVFVFLLNTFLTGLVEYISAAILVLFDGVNRFWDYSNDPFNLNGYVCLQSVLLFGLISTLYIYFVYPRFEKIFKKLSHKQVSLIFWTMFVGYGLDFMYSYLFKK